MLNTLEIYNSKLSKLDSRTQQEVKLCVARLLNSIIYNTELYYGIDTVKRPINELTIHEVYKYLLSLRYDYFDTVFKSLQTRTLFSISKLDLEPLVPMLDLFMYTFIKSDAKEAKLEDFKCTQLDKYNTDISLKADKLVAYNTLYKKYMLVSQLNIKQLDDKFQIQYLFDSEVAHTFSIKPQTTYSLRGMQDIENIISTYIIAYKLSCNDRISHLNLEMDALRYTAIETMTNRVYRDFKLIMGKNKLESNFRLERKVLEHSSIYCPIETSDNNISPMI